jgi:hypothetical protein
VDAAIENYAGRGRMTRPKKPDGKLAKWPANERINMEAKIYDPPLDPGIAHAVHVLREAAIETFESCEGGPGHAYPEPTVRFHGNTAEGFRALAAAFQADLPVPASVDVQLEFSCFCA